MARHLNIPPEIYDAAPTIDAYSLQHCQDEFYFALDYAKMDIALWALNHGVPAAELAVHLAIPLSQAEFIYGDIAAKRRATRYLYASPVLVEPVVEIQV